MRTAKGKSYCGKRAVVAVPLGLMKKGSIAFEPELPASQAAGWEAMGEGSFSKLFLKFDEPFWNTSAV